MLDKSIPYADVIMRCPWFDLRAVKDSPLPAGYSLRNYEAGDMRHWSEIETSVLEFDSITGAEAYFSRIFLPYEALLPRRMVFAVDPKGKPVATATAWFEGEGENHVSLLHWVSCMPAHQGLGLGRAVTARAMRLLALYEPYRDAILHTQTWSHRAVGLYLSLGFRALKTESDGKHANEYEKAVGILRGVMDERQYQRMIDTAE